MAADKTANLDRVIARIVAVMQPEAIYLFGSRARGDAPADSRSLEMTTPVDRDPGARLDIVPCHRSAFDQQRGRIGTLSYSATHEGRLVYGR